MDVSESLDTFLDVWIPATAKGTYRVYASWAAGFERGNRPHWALVKDDPHGAIAYRLAAGLPEVFVYLSTFSETSTAAAYAEESCLLWLDLDEADVRQTDLPQPTLMWETSRSHWQALWRLDRYLPAAERKSRNRTLQRRLKAEGADPSFDASRRLRLPGTINKKPGREDWPITIVLDTGTTYPPSAFPLPTQADPGEVKVGTMPAVPDAFDAARLLIGRGAPTWVIDLWRHEEPKGGRSDVISRLIWNLLRLGFTEEETFFIASASPSNKFRSRPQQLWYEVRRAGDQVRPPETTSARVPVHHAAVAAGAGQQPPTTDPMAGWFRRAELPSEFKTEWQVNPYLPKGSVAIVTGLPGARKSWLVTHLAVAIATGRPFLGCPILDPGPVLYYAPDDERKRLSERVHLTERFLGTNESTAFWWKQEGFNFQEPKNLDELRATIAALRPKLVVLDGLYLLGYNPQDHGASLPLLMLPIKEMAATFDLSIIVIHHQSKTRAEADDDVRLSGMGSTLLMAFFTLSWDLTQIGFDTTGRQLINLRVGGKASPSRPAYKLSFGANIEEYDIKWDHGRWTKDEIKDQAIDPETEKQGEF